MKFIKNILILLLPLSAYAQYELPGADFVYEAIENTAALSEEFVAEDPICRAMWGELKNRDNLEELSEAEKKCFDWNQLNFGVRPKVVGASGNLEEAEINAIVFGYATDIDRAYDTFTDKRGISVHYLIGKDGKVMQLVHPKWRAWYAGLSHWGNYTVHDGEACEPGACGVKQSISLNDRAIGIWLENDADGQDEYPKVQVDAAARVAKFFIDKHGIEPTNVVSYEEVRYVKEDGLHNKGTINGLLPFEALAEREVGVYPDTENGFMRDGILAGAGEVNIKIRCIQDQLRALGYQLDDDGEDLYGQRLASVVNVFHKHYRFSSSPYYWSFQDQQILHALLANKYGNRVGDWNDCALEGEDYETWKKGMSDYSDILRRVQSQKNLILKSIN